jgi:hypothetical protein
MTSPCPPACPPLAAGHSPVDFTALSRATRRFTISSALARLADRARWRLSGGRPSVAAPEDRRGCRVGSEKRSRDRLPSDGLTRAGREKIGSGVSKFRRPVRNDLAGLPQ